MSDGKFKPGQSGNPKGRPKGIIDKRQRMQTALGQGVDAVIAVIKQRALEGDMQAAGLVLSRLVPTLKPEGSLVQFELDMTAPLSKQLDSVLIALAAGQLTVENALDIAKVLQVRAEVEALGGADDKAQRLIDVFKQMAAGPMSAPDLPNERATTSAPTATETSAAGPSAPPPPPR